MSDTFSADLEQVNATLKLAMLAWRDHRTGKTPITDPVAFEAMLVSASFALAEIRVEVFVFERQCFAALTAAQRQMDESMALLRQALATVKAADAMPMPPMPALPSNVLVFTGNWKPEPANDSHGGVA